MPSEQITSHELSFVRKDLRNLFAQTDIASLVVFRIFFGLIMLIEVFRYFDRGWIEAYWIDARFNFPYWPFLSLEPLPGQGMYLLFVFLGLLAVCIMIGLFYRYSTVLFFLCFTYMFLLEQTRYLNHFYLIILLSAVLIFLPANRKFSLDAFFDKKLRSETQPLWSLWLLRFMIAIPFFYGGIAKLNPDWLAGQPLGVWLQSDTDFPIIGPYFEEHWMILLISYSGLFLDLLLVPFLLVKKTRIWAFLAALLFNLMNSELFTIGIFPWFMMVAATMFFSPSAPRYIWAAITEKVPVFPDTTFHTSRFRIRKGQKRILYALGLWAAIMLLYPLRHLVIPGNASWTEGGHKYAWHMKLRTKRVKGIFLVKDSEGNVLSGVDLSSYLAPYQQRKAVARPGPIWILARHIKEDYAKSGIEVGIYADLEARLNGRPYQQYTRPEVDLTQVPYPIWGNPDWIVPLTTPLPEQ